MDKGKSLTNMSLAEKREAPPLLDLCVLVAIRNLRYMGDVGDTASNILERILPHCTMGQLKHIQKSTKERDLTPITDKLWRKFYERTFGVERAEIVAEKMKVAKVNYLWMDLYEAKQKETDERVERSLDKFSKAMQERNAERKGGQIKTCTKVPPSRKRRSFGGNAISYNGNSKLMKMSIMDLQSSRQRMNIAAMKSTLLRRNHGVSSPSTTGGPSGSAGRNYTSNSKFNKPLERKF